MKLSMAVIKYELKTRNIEFLPTGNSIVIRSEDKDRVMSLVKETTDRNKSDFLILDNYLLEDLVIITFK